MNHIPSHQIDEAYPTSQLQYLHFNTNSAKANREN